MTLLARYVQVGDGDAVNALIDRHQADLLRTAYAVLGDAAAAQDAVQEGFLRLCREAGSLTAAAAGRTSVGGWLCTVVRNQALDHVRRRRSAPLPDQVKQPTPAHGTAHDEAAILWAVVDRLPPLERAAIHLRFRDELNYEEIGERLGKTANHVGVILNQATTRLRADPALKGIWP